MMDSRDDREMSAASAGSKKKPNDYATMSLDQLQVLAMGGDKAAAVMYFSQLRFQGNEMMPPPPPPMLGPPAGAATSTLEGSTSTKKRKYANTEEMYRQTLDCKPFNDLSASSAHLNTGHAEPDKTHHGFLPMLLELPEKVHEKICQQLNNSPLIETDLLNENDFHTNCFNLVWTVLFNSGLREVVKLSNTTQFFDVITDFTLLLRKNLFPIGGGEVKKGKWEMDRDDQGKSGEVYGQVCNEMASMTLNGPKSPPMLLTTLNQWRLVSNCPMEEIEKDIKAIQRKLGEIRQDPNVLFDDWSSAEQAKGSPEAPVIAPDSQRKTELCPPNVLRKQRKQKEDPRPTHLAATPISVANGKKEDKGSTSTSAPGETPKGKKGSTITSLVNPESRDVYTSQVFKFPSETKMVANLIYTWLLLALRGSTNRHRFDPFAKSIKAPCRALNVGREQDSGTQLFCITFGHLKEGIDFHSTPRRNQKSFLVWSPLGFTDKSMCCFATNNADGFTVSKEKKKEKDGKCDAVGAMKPRAASPCAIKFFKGPADETKSHAEKEFDIWHALYPMFSFMAVNIVFGRTYLVMPYLQAFSRSERCEMLKDQAGRSKLEAAFQWLYSKGYKYEDQDIRWRHLGWYWINNQRQIGFCDFGSMVHVGANSAGAQAWSLKAVRKLDDNLEDKAHTPPYVEQTHVPPTGSAGVELAAPE